MRNDHGKCTHFVRKTGKKCLQPPPPSLKKTPADLHLNLLNMDVTFQICMIETLCIFRAWMLGLEEHIWFMLQISPHTIFLFQTGNLAMESLLSLTSKEAGEWFKEELRGRGALDHIVDTGNDFSNICLIYLLLLQKLFYMLLWKHLIPYSSNKIYTFMHVLWRISTLHEGPRKALNFENCLQCLKNCSFLLTVFGYPILVCDTFCTVSFWTWRI